MSNYTKVERTWLWWQNLKSSSLVNLTSGSPGFPPTFPLFSAGKRNAAWCWAGASGTDGGWAAAMREAHCQSCDSRMRFHMLWWVIPPSPLHHHVVRGPESSSTLSLTPYPLVCLSLSTWRGLFLQRPSHRETQQNSLPQMTHSPTSRAPHHPLSSHDSPPHHTTPRPGSHVLHGPLASISACLLACPFLFFCLPGSHFLCLSA